VSISNRLVAYTSILRAAQRLDPIRYEVNKLKAITTVLERPLWSNSADLGGAQIVSYPRYWGRAGRTAAIAVFDP
jgi:hypothetical protein